MAKMRLFGITKSLMDRSQSLCSMNSATRSAGCFLEINDQDRLVEFKNDEVVSEQFTGLLQEIRLIEKMLEESKLLTGALPF